MKLSDLMTAGIAKTQPLQNALYKTDDSGKVCCTCAIGAAFCELYGYTQAEIKRNYGAVFNDDIAHPIAEIFYAKFGIDAYSMNLNPVMNVWEYTLSITMSLNDTYGWSREKIVNWLRSVNL